MRKECEFKYLEYFLQTAHLPSKGFKSKYYPTSQVSQNELNDISKQVMQSSVHLGTRNQEIDTLYRLLPVLEADIYLHLQLTGKWDATKN